jgi:hypothetical protein
MVQLINNYPISDGIFSVTKPRHSCLPLGVWREGRVGLKTRPFQRGLPHPMASFHQKFMTHQWVT